MTEDNAEFSLLAFSTLLLRHRWLFIRLPMALAFLAGVNALVRDRTYTSVGSFIGRSSETQSPLSGLASQFGVKVPGSETAFSPAFYAALATSATTLMPLVREDSAWLPSKDGRTTVPELYEAKGKSPAALHASALEKLHGRLSVGSDRETGIVRVGVAAPHPEAAALLAAAIIDNVSEYHLESRQEGASAERQFVEERLTEATKELRESEAVLRAFLEQNRGFDNSPQLNFRHQRLQRDVAMHQEVVTTLTQSYEQARIDEVRNLPVINIVEQPRVPAKPDPRRTIVKALIGFAFGFCLALAIAVLREVFHRDERRERELSSEYARLRADSRFELRHPGTALRRLFGMKTTNT